MNNNHSTINYNDCNFHDFSATVPSSYPECDRQTKTNSQNLIIPTETEVWKFLQDECKYLNPVRCLRKWIVHRQKEEVT